MEKKYLLKGLDCANCAQKIERAVGKVDGVKDANVNFLTTELKYTCPLEQTDEVTEKVKSVVKKVEPDVILTEKNETAINHPHEHEHHHEHSHDHSHGHSHEHGEGEKSPLPKIIITFIGLVLLHFLATPGTLPTFILYLFFYLLVGFDVVKNAFWNLFHGAIFDENFLMAVATIGAFAIGEFPEAVAVMLFYQLGEYFQDLAVENSRKSITEALSLRPDFAHLKKGDTYETVSPSEVPLFATLLVKPGEKVPLDGEILEGSAYFDTSALTGESVPRKISQGETVLSGMVNTNASITFKVLKDDANSTATKILELVENASSQKAPAEKFITKFARYYTPAVVGFALLLALIPPLFFQGDFYTWIYRALTFLVISCPCALVISVPLSFFAGIGGASKHGILIKGSQHLESLAQLKTVVFDKTGTLTKGNFVLTTIENTTDKEALLQLAASLEVNSNHPIAKVIQKSNTKPLLPVTDIEEVAGFGLKGQYEGATLLAGNHKLLEKFNIQAPLSKEVGTLIYVAKGKEYLGTLVIQDEIKPEAKTALENLKASGVEKTVLLTGDTKAAGENIGATLGLDTVKSQLLPQDKVTALEEELYQTKGKVAFVGDGMNDAPVLARADLGIAMGGLGSDAAIEASDVVIMEDQLDKIPVAIKVAKKTMKLVKENIIFALGVKLLVLLLGAFGLASMAAAVFADVGVTLIAVLNALRALKK